ncbi:unnamed protein product, partial [marine sediment metagenome]
DAKDYFEKTAPKFDYKFKKVISIKEVKEYTNSSYIYKIKVKKNKKIETVYLKHSKDYLKLKELKFFVGAKRLICEVKTMRYFEKLFGPSVVPHVIFFDKKNFSLVMSDIHGKGRRLINEFYRNNVHPEIGSRLGHILGLLHATTYGTRKMVRESEDNREFINLSIRFKTNVGIEMCAKETLDLIEESRKSKNSVIWGDAIIKNMVVEKGRV